MSFTRDQLIEQYKRSQLEAGISPEMFIISAGGALVMHGIRESTDDLDIDTNEANYNALVDAGYPLIDDGFPRLRLNESTDVHSVKIPWVETIVVDGVWCYTPEYLVTQYEKLATHPARNPEKVERDQLTVTRLKKLIALR